MTDYGIEMAKNNAEALQNLMVLLAHNFPHLEAEIMNVFAGWRQNQVELDAFFFDDPDLCEK